MTKYDIVTIGDASEDIFVSPRDLKVSNDSRFIGGKGVSFELGEKILLDNVQYEVGGSACNNAVALSRQGYKTAAIVAIGNDTPGQNVINTFEREGVDCALLKQDQQYKTNFSVVFNISDERTIFVYHGLENYICIKPNLTLHTDWIFLAPLGEGGDEVINNVVSLASEKNVRVAWNPGGTQIKMGARHYKSLLACTKILFINKEEGIKFVNFPIPPRTEEVIKKLFEYGVSVVVMTDGKKGATAYDGNKFYHADALTQERVDATGAGDSFATGFCGQIMEFGDCSEENIIQALKSGVVNSTSVVSFIGAQKGLLSRSEIESEINGPREINTQIT